MARLVLTTRRALVVLAAVVALAGCGADPRPPAPDATAADAAPTDGGSDAVDAAADAGCERFATPPRRLAFSTDGARLAVAHAGGGVSVIDLATGRIVRSLRVIPPDSDDPLIALTEDGARLASASAGTVSIWDVASGERAQSFEVGAGTSGSLKFSDDPAPLLLATVAPPPGVVAKDNVKAWRVSDGLLVALLSGSPIGTFTFADTAVLLVDPAGASFQVLSFGGRVLGGGPLAPALTSVAFAADGAFFAGVSAGGALTLISTREARAVWQAPAVAPRALVFLENPSRLIQIGARTIVHEHLDGSVLLELPALAATTVVTAAPDGASLATADASGALTSISTSDGAARPLAASCR